MKIRVTVKQLIERAYTILREALLDRSLLNGKEKADVVQ